MTELVDDFIAAVTKLVPKMNRMIATGAILFQVFNIFMPRMSRPRPCRRHAYVWANRRMIVDGQVASVD